MPFSGTVRATGTSLLSLALVASSALAGGDLPRHWGRDRPVDLQHVLIDLAIDVKEGRITGHAELTVAALHDETTSARLDAIDFDLQGVRVDGRPAESDYDGEVIDVRFPRPLAAGERAVIRVDYAASPRAGLFFVVPDRAYPEKQLQCWSQGEDEDNRHWFPVHDHPNERATSETRITVAKPLKVVANGPATVQDNGDGTRTWHHRMDFPHVPYLVSIAVGDWVERRETWRDVELTYHVPKGMEDDMDRSFRHTAQMLEFLSEFIGVDYPYSVYRQTCVTDYMFGGMENIAATTLNENTLHDERAHGDWLSEGLVAHEVAHQWFGDYVTCEDWSEIWINEGFATYYGTLSVGDVFGQEHFDVTMDDLRASAIRADSGEKRRPIVTNQYEAAFDLFDGHAYAKGAMVLHALRREVGDERFHRAIKLFLERHVGTSVDTHELIDAVEDATGRDVSRFFHQWIYGAGQPELEVKWKPRDGGVAVTIRQVQAQSDLVGLFDVPLDIQVLGDGWVVDRAVRIDDAQESFHFDVQGEPRAVVVDPQGWLLRTVDMERKPRETAWVAENAPLLLARLEALRDLTEDAGRPAVLATLTRLLSGADGWSVRREAARTLGHARGDEARDALLRALTGDEESRVRTAVAESLKGFPSDVVRSALRRALTTDRSYAVRAAAALSLGEIGGPGVQRALESALRQRSHREVVFRDALSAIRELDSERAASLALTWSAYGKPSESRSHAIRTRAQVAADWADASRRRGVRKELVALLDDPLFWMRVAAVDGLADLGDADSLVELKRVAASAPEVRMRRTARRAIKRLEKHVDGKRRVAELSKELEKERKARKELEKRLDELAARLPEDDRSSR